MAADEGPYRQSERHDRYAAAIESLWDAGFLYACDCTRQDVEDRVAARKATGGDPTPGYDGHCRDRGLERGPTTALRFRTPEVGETTVHDLVRGDVTFPHQAMEDFVAVKSSGQPLFALANVIDDRDMAITHVIRGEDLLPTTPKGLLLWEALDEAAGGEAGGDRGGAVTPLPEFAHLPMLVNEQRKKLSKRRDPVAVELYRSQGYLPEAFRNYLALLGWSPPGEEEKVGLDTLIGAFRLEEVHHAPAFFDVKKLTHLNGEYIRELPVEGFVAAVRPWVAPVEDAWVPEGHAPPWPPERFDEETFARIAPLVQERVTVLGEAPAMVDFLFLPDPPLDEAAWEKSVTRDEEAVTLLQAALDRYRGVEWSAGALHAATLEVAEASGRKLGKAQAPIRVAVTGRSVGPPLFESLEVLGREETLRRVSAALDRAGASATGAAG